MTPLSALPLLLPELIKNSGHRHQIVIFSQSFSLLSSTECSPSFYLSSGCTHYTQNIQKLLFIMVGGVYDYVTVCWPQLYVRIQMWRLHFESSLIWERLKEWRKRLSDASIILEEVLYLNVHNMWMKTFRLHKVKAASQGRKHVYMCMISKQLSCVWVNLIH